MGGLTTVTKTQLTNEFKKNHNIIEYRFTHSHYDEQTSVSEFVVLRHLVESYEPWVTHVMTVREDREPEFQWGHYFKEHKRADEDFKTR